jgi:HSP20 family protein
MANVTKKDNGPQPQTQLPQQQQQLIRRDPFWQLMRDPFQMIRDFFVDPFRAMQSPYIGRELAWNPSFEVRETDNAYVFKGDLPGVKQDDIEISLLENRLLITGKRDSETEQDEGTLHTYERSYGSFQRAFMLPDNADLDKISTGLKDGVLTIAVPKKETKGQQARKIQIGSGQKS